MAMFAHKEKPSSGGISLRLKYPETTAPETLEHISLLLGELALRQLAEGGDCDGEKEAGQMPVSGIHKKTG